MTDFDKRFFVAHTQAGWSTSQLYYGVRAPLRAPREALLALMEGALERKLSYAFLMVLEGPDADTDAGCILALADQIHSFSLDDQGVPEGEAFFEDDQPVYTGEVRKALEQADALLALGKAHGIDLSELLAATPSYFFHSISEEPSYAWLGQSVKNNRDVDLKMVQKAMDEAGFERRIQYAGVLFGEPIAELDGPGTVDLPDLEDQARTMQTRLDAFFQTKGGARIYKGWLMDEAEVFVVAEDDS
jgi:hypothetical protein